VDPKQLAQGVGAGRAALGAGFILRPGLLGRLWVGSKADDGGVKVLIRAIGARDLTIGAGILAAIAAGRPVRRWVEAATVSDAVDCAAALVAGDSIPRYARWAILLLGGSSAIQGALAAPKLGEG
jgi:hypothetical protein